MIKLVKADYCTGECGKFEADVETFETFSGEDSVVIKCKNCDICDQLYRYIKMKTDILSINLGGRR